MVNSHPQLGDAIKVEIFHLTGVHSKSEQPEKI